MKNHYSAKELAEMALPSLPGTVQNITTRATREGWPSRPRKGRGGGREYPLSALPPATQTAIILKSGGAQDAPADTEVRPPSLSSSQDQSSNLWQAFDRLPEKQKAEAHRRLKVLQAVAQLLATGMPKMEAYQQAASQAALTALVQQVALAEAANTAAAMDFDSANQAGEIRDALLEALDTQAETADDAAYLALMALRAGIVQDANARGANLARIANYTPPATVPALVLAHRLYGDATRGDEIATRNNAPHPGFLPGGEPLEVLTHA